MKPPFKRSQNVRSSTHNSSINEDNGQWKLFRRKSEKILNRSLRCIRKQNKTRRSNGLVHHNNKNAKQTSIKRIKKLIGDVSILEDVEGYNEDAYIFRDLDLLILGSPPEEYQNYCNLLRKEYTHMDDKNFKAMRLKVFPTKLSNSKKRRRGKRYFYNKEENNSSPMKKTISTNNIDSIDDDDCVFVEPTVEIICIDDENISPKIENKTYKSSTIISNNQSIQQPLNCEIIILDNSMTQENGGTSDALVLSKNNIFSNPSHQKDPNNDNMSYKIEKVLDGEGGQWYRRNNNYISIQEESSSSDDDVIEIIDETLQAPNFIPFSKDSPKRQGSSRKRNKSKNCKENENFYNPNKNIKPSTKKRMVIIDGNNVAYSHSCSREFSVRGLQICIDYFLQLGHEVKAVIPQMRLKKSRSSDPEILRRLHLENKIVFTPCKNLFGKETNSYDDRIILQLADELDGVIISNDNFKDLFNENESFQRLIKSRVVGYTWCNDVFILPKDPYGRWGPPLSEIMERRS